MDVCRGIGPIAVTASRAPTCNCRSQDELVSKISRKSIDLLKEHFRDDLSKDDWRLVVKLKSIFEIA